jgi:hypothetical protein
MGRITWGVVVVFYTNIAHRLTKSPPIKHGQRNICILMRNAMVDNK